MLSTLSSFGHWCKGALIAFISHIIYTFMKFECMECKQFFTEITLNIRTIDRSYFSLKHSIQKDYN